MKRFLIVFSILILTIISVHAESHKIAVIGSSVSAGWGGDRNDKFDFLNGWVNLLAENLSDKNLDIINLSVPGSNTIDVLERFDSEIDSVKSDIAIIALSLSNEGLEREPGDSVIRQFETNIKKIIDKCTSRGIKPVLATCYSNNMYNREMYNYLLIMNDLIESWDYPVINITNALDDGNGNFPEGYSFDPNHPDSKGHKEMFLSIEPEIFNKILNGAYPNSISKSSEPVLLNDNYIYIPDDPMHSFTYCIDLNAKTNSEICRIECINRTINVKLDRKGQLIINKTNTKRKMPIDTISSLFLVHNHANSTLSAYINNELVYSETAQVEPIAFTLMKNQQYSNIGIYRIPLTDDGIEDYQSGDIPVPGLSVFTDCSNENNTLVNKGLAAESFVRQKNTNELRKSAIDNLSAFNSIPEFSFSDFYNVINLNKSIYDLYIGRYFLGDMAFFDVISENNRLWVNPNGVALIELLPLTTTKYIAKAIGPEAFITFFKGDSSDTFDKLEFFLEGIPDTFSR